MFFSIQVHTEFAKAKARIDNNLRSVTLYKYLQYEAYNNSLNYKLKKRLLKMILLHVCSVKKEYASIERDPVYLSYS